jgi:hypothetical protein
MAKEWGKQCQTGLCFNGEPTQYCEPFYPNGCRGGDVGLFNIESLKPEEIEASTAKFYGTRDPDGNLLLEEPGFLAKAGLRRGDTLLGINSLSYSDEKDRQEILHCRFTRSHLLIHFRYNGGKLDQNQTIENPAYSLPPDQ